MLMSNEIILYATETNIAKRLRTFLAPLKKEKISVISSIEMALSEAVENAIEHGCLDIGFQLKRTLIEYNQYDKELKRRRGKPASINKKTIVSYTYTGESLQFCVTDEGSGFAWSDFTKTDEESANRSLNVSGSGLKIITTVFDSVVFNKEGNKLTMIKYLKYAEEQ